MRNSLALLFIVASLSATAQVDTSFHLIPMGHKPFERHSTIATLSLGFVDYYRNNYSLPAGFQKNNTTGYTPVYAKLEYGITKHISIAGTFGYDAFSYNFSQQYEGNNGQFTRYIKDNARIFSGGVTAFYHLTDLIHVPHLDPFIGIGASLNNIRYSAYPQGDSTTTKIDHTVTPYLKAGARYYITSKFSLFADAGYDKHSAFSIGASCRFVKKKFYPDADRDGIPDYADSCIHEPGLAKLHGCPDADGDGIPDKEDACPHQPGPLQYHGCPDSDADGIVDKDDDCPNEKGLANLRGCPDRDGDGIPDKDDACPDVFGTAALHGCPEKEHVFADPVVILPELTQLPAKLIKFHTGSAVIQKVSYSYLDSVTDILNSHRPVDIVIDGYTDNTGNATINNKLSIARAEAVKAYLVKNGRDAATIFITGHGSKAPISSNHTKAGRAKNRRATIKLKV